MHVHLSHFSQVQLFSTLWTTAGQAPLSIGFSRQEYWNGLPCPPLGNLPDPGIEPTSLIYSVLAGRFFTTSATWEVPSSIYEANIYQLDFVHYLGYTDIKKYPCLPWVQNLAIGHTDNQRSTLSINAKVTIGYYESGKVDWDTQITVRGGRG